LVVELVVLPEPPPALLPLELPDVVEVEGPLAGGAPESESEHAPQVMTAPVAAALKPVQRVSCLFIFGPPIGKFAPRLSAQMTHLSRWGTAVSSHLIWPGRTKYVAAKRRYSVA
jgi:hypothetical protein